MAESPAAAHAMACRLFLPLLALVSLFGGSSACALNNVGGATCSKDNCGKLLGYFQTTAGAFVYQNKAKLGGINYEYYDSLVPLQYSTQPGNTNAPYFEYLTQTAAGSVSECCAKCSSTYLCQMFRYFPTGTLDSFQYLKSDDPNNLNVAVNPSQNLLFSYNTPLPSCWPSASYCPGYNVDDGNSRCILFKINTDKYLDTKGAACTSPSAAKKCYPAVPDEVSYTYAPNIVANNKIGSNGGMTGGGASGRPRSYWGGLCNPYVNTSGSDDPHFVGGDGVRFDFNGEVGRSFCLLTDQRVHINMLINGYRDARAAEGMLSSQKTLRSWITAVSYLWKDEAGETHTLYLEARKGRNQERGNGFISKATIDGEEITIPKQIGEQVEAAGAKMKLESQRNRGGLDMDTFSLDIPGVISTTVSTRVAHPLLQTPREAYAHFNIQVNEYQPTKAVHGVLGQTLREDSTRLLKSLEYRVLASLLHGPIKADGVSGAGYLDGSTEDYITSSLTAPDCKYSSF